MQPDLMRFILDKFYEFSHGDDKKDHFTLSVANQALMTMHALVLALIADGFVIGPAEFEGLRSHLKLQPAQLAKYFKCAVESLGAFVCDLCLHAHVSHSDLVSEIGAGGHHAIQQRHVVTCDGWVAFDWLHVLLCLSRLTSVSSAWSTTCLCSLATPACQIGPCKWLTTRLKADCLPCHVSCRSCL